MADTELNNLVNEIQNVKINIQRAKRENSRLQLTQRDIFKPRVKLTTQDIFRPPKRTVQLTERDILINKQTFPDLEEIKFRKKGKDRISDEKRLEELIKNRRKRAKANLQNIFEQKETLVNNQLLNDEELKIFNELEGTTEFELQKSLVGRGDIRDKRIKPRSSLQKALSMELRDKIENRIDRREKLRSERFDFGVKSFSLKSISKTIF